MYEEILIVQPPLRLSGCNLNESLVIPVGCTTRKIKVHGTIRMTRFRQKSLRIYLFVGTFILINRTMIKAEVFEKQLQILLYNKSNKY